MKSKAEKNGHSSRLEYQTLLQTLTTAIHANGDDSRCESRIHSDARVYGVNSVDNIWCERFDQYTSRIINRLEDYMLEWDAQTQLDFLGIAGSLTVGMTMSFCEYTKTIGAHNLHTLPRDS